MVLRDWLAFLKRTPAQLRMRNRRLRSESRRRIPAPNSEVLETRTLLTYKVTYSANEFKIEQETGGDTSNLRFYEADPTHLVFNDPAVKFNVPTAITGVTGGGTNTLTLDLTLFNLPGATSFTITTGDGDDSIKIGNNGVTDVPFTHTLPALNVDAGNDAGDKAGIFSDVTLAANRGLSLKATNTIPDAIGLKGNVTTSGTGKQSYLGNVELQKNLTITSNSDVTFQGTVNSKVSQYNSLTVATPGATWFQNDVGMDAANKALGGLKTTDGGVTKLGNAVPITVKTTKAPASTGEQTYVDDVQLLGTTSLLARNNGNITLGDTVTGAFGLTTETKGIASFENAIDVNSLTTQGDLGSNAGTTDLNGSTVKTLAKQTYGNNVLLTADATLTSTSNDDITFAGTVDSAVGKYYALTVNTAGKTLFQKNVGTINTTALGSLSTDLDPLYAGGTTQFNNATVRTNRAGAAMGNQAWNDDVQLLGSTTFIALSGGNITFDSKVDGNFDLLTQTKGIVDFKDAVTVKTIKTQGELGSTNGTTDLNGGTVTTAGAQTYGNPVVLTKDALLTSNNGDNISFLRTVDGPFNLTTVTDGAAIFAGVVGTTPLNSLTTKGKTVVGTAQLNGGPVTTATFQTYNNVTLGTTETLTSNTAGDITFGGTVNGAKNLVVVTDGAAIFNDLVGNTALLASLTTKGKTNPTSGSTQLKSTAITTTNFQTYDNITLGADAVLTSNAGGIITFAGSIDGAQNLKTVTDGTVIFKGVVGTIPLNSLTTQGKTPATGTTQFNGGSITTTTSQAYNNNALLATNTFLTSNAGNNITFGGTVNGAKSLLITTDGAAIFNGVVGTTPLASLTTQGKSNPTSGTTQINTGSVTTNGVQTYDNLTLGASANLTSNSSGKITFAGTISGLAQDLNTFTNGIVDFEGNATLANLTTKGKTPDNLGTTDLNGGTITTTGQQNYFNPVVLTDNTTLNGNAGSITFNRTVNGTYDLITQTDGKMTFRGAVGNINPLASLVTQGKAGGTGGETDLNGGTAETTGRQSYGNPVILGADTTLTSTSSGKIEFLTTVKDLNPGTQFLVVETSGDTVFSGQIGPAGGELESLETKGGGKTVFNVATTPAVTTTGDQKYGDDVQLNLDTTLTSPSGKIEFLKTVKDLNPGTQFLVVETSGDTVFNGQVGPAGGELESLETKGGGKTVFNVANVPAVTTTTYQKYGDNVLLNQNTTLTSKNSGDITFLGTVDSQANKFATLAVNTAGNTIFQKNVGMVAANQALGALMTDVDPLYAGGTTRFAGAGITVKTSKAAATTGNQIYNDDVVLQADTTLIAVNKGNITFQKTVTGPAALITQTDGVTTFEDAVNINKLTTQGATGTGNLGTTDLNGKTVTTVNEQTYKNAVVLTDNTLLTSTGNKTIEFQGTVNGTYDLTTQTNGQARFLKPVGGATPLASLTTQGNTTGSGETDLNGGTVKTTQRQTFQSKVVLGANTILTSTAGGTPAGDITFAGTVDSEASKYWTLTVNTGGATWFQQSVGAGANQALGSLTTDAAGTTQLGNGGTIAVNTAKSAAPVTTGNQTFNDNLKLLANATLTAKNLTANAPPNISFQGTVSGAAQNLTTITAGTVRFHRDIALINLTLNGQNAATSQVLLGDTGSITASLTGTMTIQGVKTVTGFSEDSKSNLHYIGNADTDAVFVQFAPAGAMIQNLNIYGDVNPNPTKQGTASGHGILVNASNLTLQNLSIHNLAGDGIEVNSAQSGVKMTQNTIDNNGGIAIDLQAKPGHGEELSNGVSVNDKYQTTLSAQVPIFTTGTISVFDAWQFKTLAVNFPIKIDSETMTVTNVNTDTNKLTVTRTMPQIHDAGALVAPVNAPLADSDDSADGANNLQNTPEILYAYLAGSALQVYYQVPSAFNDDTHKFTVEFYLADDAGRGGSQHIATETYDLYDPTGKPLVKSTLLNVTDQVQLGKQIIATATDSAGNTSEFSRAAVVNLPPDQIGVNGYLTVSGPANPASISTNPGTPQVNESPFLNFAWDNTGGPNRPAAAYNNELGVFPVHVGPNGTITDAAPGTPLPFRNLDDGNGGLFYTRLYGTAPAGTKSITVPTGLLSRLSQVSKTSAKIDGEIVTLDFTKSNTFVVNNVSYTTFQLETQLASSHADSAKVEIQDNRLGAAMMPFSQVQNLAFSLKHTVTPLNAPAYGETFYSVPQFNSDSLKGNGGQKINLHLNSNQGFDKDGNPYNNPSFPLLSHNNVNNPVRFRQSDGTLILPWEESKNAGDQDFNDAVIQITDPWLRPISPPSFEKYDTATPFATIAPGPVLYTGPNMLISDKNAPLSEQASIQGGDFSINPTKTNPLDGGVLIVNIQVPVTGIAGDQLGFLTPAGYTLNSNVLSKGGKDIGIIDTSLGPTIFKMEFKDTATKADAETVMRSLTYTRGNGSSVTRTIRFSLRDSSGATNGNLGARSISFNS